MSNKDNKAELDAIREHLDAMHKVWLEEEPNLASMPVNQEVTNEVCWRLIQNGIQPTCDNIRAVHGGGSPTTVHRLLRAFYATGELGRRWTAPPPPPVPTEFVEFADAWTLAVAKARSSIKDELAEKVADLAAATDAVVEREAACSEQVKAANALAEKAIVDADTRVELVDELMAGLRLSLEVETRSGLSAASALKTANTHAEKLAGELDAVRLENTGWRDEAKATQASLQSALDAKRDALSEADKLRAEVLGLANTIASLEAAGATERSAHQAQLTDIQDQLAVKQKRVDELVEARTHFNEVLVRTRDELDDATEERDGLRTQLDRVTKDERAASLALATAEGRVAELERTRGELVSALDAERVQLAAVRDEAAAESAKWRQLLETITPRSSSAKQKDIAGAKMDVLSADESPPGAVEE